MTDTAINDLYMRGLLYKNRSFKTDMQTIIKRSRDNKYNDHIVFPLV